MKPTAVHSLDLGAWDRKAAKPSSKEDKSAFENEMVESEKRMRKKSKVDGREASVSQQGTASQRNVKSDKKEQDSVTERRTPKSQSVKTTNNTSEAAQTTPLMTENVIPQESMVTPEELLSANTPTDSFSLNMMQLDGKNGVDLQGFQAIKPQMLETAPLSELSTLPTEINSTDLMSVVTATNSAEKNLSDLLSQNSEQQMGGGEFSSDLTALMSAPIAKDGINTAPFSSVLEAKVQDLGVVTQENVENLVTQASAVLKDGGGEMKLQLRPEGLGTVDLKVGLQNGQVSIEIIAQDQSVKKMFEESVVDIRNALETQNLKIDTFKVGVSEHFDQSMAQQNASQFAEREFARDFMGQFRDERQALRSQTIDNMLQNRNPMQQSPEGLQPAVSRINSNGRLNIIA